MQRRYRAARLGPWGCAAGATQRTSGGCCPRPAGSHSGMASLTVPVLGVAVPLIGGLIVVVVAVALVVWYRSYRLRAEPPPPELTDDVPGPPAERDSTWDPRERYEG